MSFLELKPAARRLRQVAKAHAAGEIQRGDYRRLRREIIEELHVDFADPRRAGAAVVDGFSLGGDDTQRRADPELVGVSPVLTASSSRVPRIIALCVILLGLLVGLSAFATTIPPVSERDPNPQNSLVISIQGLQIADFPAAPGIERAEVEALLKEWFDAAVVQSSRVESSGFSASELAEVGGLLRRLGVHEEGGLDSAAVSALNALALRQRSRRGVSLAQLEKIAALLEKFYRSRGFLVARAFVPAQKIVGDHALLKVLPGRLSRVDIVANTPLAALARRAFEPQLGSYAQLPSLERLLYRLNDLPGVRATGGMRAGEEVGDTALALTLDSPSRLVPSVTFDNHGDERSARYRLNGRVDWENPLRRGDRLSFSVAQKFDPESAHAVELAYQSPGLGLGDTLVGSFSFNDFTIAPREIDQTFDGQATTFRLGARRLVFGDRTSSLSVGLGGAVQELELGTTNQRLFWISPQIDMHRVLDGSRWVLRGNTNVVAGRITSGRYESQSSGFVRAQTLVSAWRPIGRQTLRLQVTAQIGSKDLPDSQKMRLGGVNQLSSLRPGSFIADSAFVAGMEMSVTPDSWRSFSDLEVFTRVAHGDRTLSDDRESAFAWDGGLLWRVSGDGPFSGALRLSVPLVTNGMEDSHDFARVLFDFAWQP